MQQPAHSRSTKKNKKLPHATAISISAENRSAAVAILNQHLANVSDLYSQTKQAHWNVRGEEFYQLHKLFDELAGMIEPHIDSLAERAVTLGGFALGTVRCAANASEIPEFPLESGGFEYVEELASRFAAVANSVRAGIEKTDELGDASTADLLTEVSRDLDQAVYFLEAHIRR